MFIKTTLLAAAMLAATLAPLPTMAQTPDNAPRFAQITLDQLDPSALALGEEIMKISSVGLGGPYNIMLRSPVMADRLKRLLDYLRFNTSLPTRLNEFAIIIQGRLWTSQVEWYAHYPLALKAGLKQSIADDLKANIRPRGMQPDEEIVYDVSMELSKNHKISDDLFARAKAVLGERQLVDLVAVNGTYVMVAMLLAVGEVTVPAGKAEPFDAAGK
jgi:4-carboxymuconolactone decarboxylase